MRNSPNGAEQPNQGIKESVAALARSAVRGAATDGRTRATRRLCRHSRCFLVASLFPLSVSVTSISERRGAHCLLTKPIPLSSLRLTELRTASLLPSQATYKLSGCVHAEGRFCTLHLELNLKAYVHSVPSGTFHPTLFLDELPPQIQFSLSSLLLLLCVPFGERAGTRRKPERQIERRTAAAGSHGQVVFGACVRLAAAAAEKRGLTSCFMNCP